MKRVAVIGKNSYIGDSFANYCRNDFSIDIIDSLNDHWKTVDLTVYDTVYLVAGIAHVSTDPKLKQLYFRVNRDLAIDVAVAAKKAGVKQFVFMSSMIIYGKDGAIGKKKVIDGTTPFSPLNYYGRSKLEADIGIQMLQDEDFKVVIIRTPIVYGPNCKGNFPKLMHASERFFLFPRIQNARSMIYIDNLLEFIKLAIMHEIAGVFFPQNTEYVCTSEVVKQAARLLGRKIWCTKLFYPILWIASRLSGKISKIFGNKVYDKKLSQTFNNAYNIVNFQESIKRCLK